VPDRLLGLLPLAALVLVAGWAVGWVSARYTNALLLASDEPLPGSSRGWLLDPWVQAGCAVAWTLAFLHYATVDAPFWRWLVAALLAVPLVQVTVTDLRLRIVFTHIAYATTAAGILLSPLLHPAPPWWWSFVLSLLGTVGGFVAFAFLYWLGKRLYRGVEAMAWGDVLIAAMVGAISGPFTGPALIAGVVISGLIALGFVLVRRDRRAFMPYGPGLCVGAYLAFFMSLPGAPG
jgi:hypothetical protein